MLIVVGMGFFVSSFSLCTLISEIGKVYTILMSYFSSIDSPHSGRHARDSVQWCSQSKYDARAQHNSMHTFYTLSRAWFNITIHIILIQTKSAL